MRKVFLGVKPSHESPISTAKQHPARPGWVMQLMALVLLFPIIPLCWYWDYYGDGWQTLWAFVGPAVLSLIIGLLLRKLFSSDKLDKTGALLMCAIGWVAAAGVGALPFVFGIQSSYIDGYFEAMSGFTTTGITVFEGLDLLPRSIPFWRAWTQWLGGLGILSFFLVATFWGAGAH